MANARSRQLTVSTLFLLTSLRATSVYSTGKPVEIILDYKY